MTALLEVDDLHVWFDLQHGGELHAVRGLSFRLEAGRRRAVGGQEDMLEEIALEFSERKLVGSAAGAAAR